MSGEEAEGYIRRRATVEESVMQLRLRYVPDFRKVLSGRRHVIFSDRMAARSHDQSATGTSSDD